MEPKSLEIIHWLVGELQKRGEKIEYLRGVIAESDRKLGAYEDRFREINDAAEMINNLRASAEIYLWSGRIAELSKPGEK